MFLIHGSIIQKGLLSIVWIIELEDVAHLDLLVSYSNAWSETICANMWSYYTARDGPIHLIVGVVFSVIRKIIPVA